MTKLERWPGTNAKVSPFGVYYVDVPDPPGIELARVIYSGATHGDRQPCFILGTFLVTGEGWWYQYLHLTMRPRHVYRALLPHVAKFYRELKKAGVLDSVRRPFHTL